MESLRGGGKRWRVMEMVAGRGKWWRVVEGSGNGDKVENGRK